jgi:hypothetical protein
MRTSNPRALVLHLPLARGPDCPRALIPLQPRGHSFALGLGGWRGYPGGQNSSTSARPECLAAKIPNFAKLGPSAIN